MEIKEHTKYYNIENKEVPSVTTVIKLLDKPQLIGWANYLGFRGIKVEELLHEKATYGTAVHDMFEQFIMGITCGNPNDPHLTNLRNKFKYIVSTLKDKGYEIINMEMQMHGMLVGGTLDLLVKHKASGKYMILDLKTSKDIYNSMYIQLGGYSLLIKELYNIDVAAVGIILISKDVTDKKFFSIVTRENNVNNEEIFKRLLDIYYLLDK